MKRFLLIAAFALCWRPASAQTLYVPTVDYPTIQSAINAAAEADIIIVDSGTYYENINFLGRAITLTSTDPNDPHIVDSTIIDGNQPGDVNNASVVTFNSGEANNSVLTGFTITGGTGSWLKIYWQFKGYLWNRCGGGLLCYNSSSPTINKNVFRDNLAGQGGGIYFYNHSNPVITENTFISNSAIVNHGFDDPDPDDPNIYDHGDGGAIVGFQYCDATIADNLIENNHAEMYGGGIHLRQWSNGLIEDNQIIGNDSSLGAGVHITYTSSPTVRGNLIQANMAGDFGGGGIYVIQYCNPLIEYNLVTQNESTNGAGVYVTGDSQPLIRNNLIVNNINGAGVRVKGGAIPTIVNNTIAGNMQSASLGGGIDCTTTSVPIIENNIIVSNGNSYGIYASINPPVIKYNNVWDHGAGNYSSIIGDQTGINGNISVDPLFVDEPNNDYHLKSNGWRWDMLRNRWHYDDITSRCIDAGNPGYALADELLTVPEDPNGRWAENLRINMGAYGATAEASLPPHDWALWADITNDGIIDFNDLDALVDAWLTTGTNNPGDLNRNQKVNQTDYAILANDWLCQTSWR